MATFHGTLRLAAEPDAVHSATVILVDGRFVLRAAGSEIGDWPLHDLNFSYAGEEIRVKVDSDEALLSMPERGAFAAAVGLAESGVDSVPSPAPSAEVTIDQGQLAEPEDASPEPTGADDDEPADPEPFAVNLDPAPAPTPTPLPTEPPEVGAPPGSDPTAPSDPTGAAPASDFSVGLSGDEWATNDPVAVAPEPPFAVGEIGSEPLPPDGVSAPPSGVASPSDPAPAPETPPVPDEGPWAQSAEPPAAADDLDPDPSILAPADDISEPVPALGDAEPDAAGAEESATGEPDSEAALEADVTTAPATDSAVSSTAADSPTDDASQTNDLPVEAAGAATAVWGVRSRPPDESSAPAPSAIPGGAPDDLVAERLAAQRDSTLGSTTTPKGEVEVSDVESTVAEPYEAATDEEEEQAPVDDGPADAVDPAMSLTEPAEPEEEADDGLGRLREQSAAGYEDAETLRKWVAWGLVIGGGLIGIGAFLTWGNTRMFDTDFPVARALAGLAAVASVAGFILGFFMHRRTEGAYVAGTGAVLGLMTLVAYGRAAGLGVGFFLTLLGVLVVAGLSILAITPAGESHAKRDNR